MNQIGEAINEGKGKRIFATDNPDEVVVFYKDETIAFHGLKRGRIIGKGEINNRICEYIFSLLEKQGIPNHFIKRIDDRSSLVKKVEIVPVTVKVRNIVAGSLARRTGYPEGTHLRNTVIEYCLKDAELEDPLVNLTHITAMNLATVDEIRLMEDIAIKVNQILTGVLKEINIELIDFKLEFGRYKGKIILSDEITPDTCRFWDANTHELLEKQHFRKKELPSIRSIALSGGKLKKELQQKYLAWCKESGREFFVVYGQCESVSHISYLQLDKNETKIDSVGKAIPNGEIKLLDKQGNIVTKSNSVGEVYYYGDNVILGYASSINDLAMENVNKGILATGDLGQFDADGFLAIVGRKRRFIKISGERINLDAIENIIKEQFASLDCACTGKDEKLSIFIDNKLYIPRLTDYLLKTTGIQSTNLSVIALEYIPKNNIGKTSYQKLNND